MSKHSKKLNLEELNDAEEELESMKSLMSLKDKRDGASKIKVQNFVDPRLHRQDSFSNGSSEEDDATKLDPLDKRLQNALNKHKEYQKA